MKIFPAVDILDNKAVRLIKGRREDVTIYGDPLEMAHKWADMGAQYLHIVDLNAAFGEPNKNDDILKKIASDVKTTLEIRGGMRSQDRVKYVLDELGFNRIVLGTSIVTNRALVENLAKIYGKRIVAGLDAQDGLLRIKGWLEQSRFTPLETALWLKELGVGDIIFTDISRDGTQKGVNLESVIELQKKSRMNVIASGGVGSLEDLLRLKEKGAYGAIIGKALYGNKIDLREALRVCR